MSGRSSVGPARYRLVMDPVTAKVGAEVAKETGGLARQLLAEMFGPQARAFGEDKAEEQRKRRATKVVEKASRKTTGGYNPAILRVPERVMAAIGQEPYLDTDEIYQEYLAGVIAGSMSSDARDDSGVAVLATIKTLSVRAIKLHHALYYTFRAKYLDCDLNLGTDSEQLKLWVSLMQMATNVEIDSSRSVEAVDIANEVVPLLIGELERAQLISYEVIGDHGFLRKQHAGIPGDGAILRPTNYGADVWRWAHGDREGNANVIFESTRLYDFDPALSIFVEALTFTELNQRVSDAIPQIIADGPIPGITVADSVDRAQKEK